MFYEQIPGARDELEKKVNAQFQNLSLYQKMMRGDINFNRETLANLINDTQENVNKMNDDWEKDALQLYKAEHELNIRRKEFVRPSRIRVLLVQRLLPKTYQECKRMKIRPIYERGKLLREIQAIKNHESEMISNCSMYLHHVIDEYRKYARAKGA